MDFTEIVKGGDIYVAGNGSTVTAILQKKTANDAISILGRELCQGEDFYWIESIENKSGIRGAGTQLLKYLTSVSYHGSRTYAVEARPLKGSVWHVSDTNIVQRWLYDWYRKCGFTHPVTIKDAQVFKFDSGVFREHVRVQRIREFEESCGL